MNELNKNKEMYFFYFDEVLDWGNVRSTIKLKLVTLRVKLNYNKLSSYSSRHLLSFIPFWDSLPGFMRSFKSESKYFYLKFELNTIRQKIQISKISKKFNFFN